MAAMWNIAGPRVLHRRTGRLCNGMAAMWNIAESFTGTTVAVPNSIVKRAFFVSTNRGI